MIRIGRKNENRAAATIKGINPRLVSMPAPAFLLPSVSRKSKIGSRISALAVCYGFDAAYLYVHLPDMLYRHLHPAMLSVIGSQQHVCVIRELPVPDKYALLLR